MRKTNMVKTKIISLLALIAIVLSITLSSAGIISVLASFTFAANVQPFTSKKYTYSWTEVTENDHTEEVYFDCYPINSGYSGSRPGIAIAWHNEEEGPKNDTPDYLEVPKTLYDTSNAPYDVVAIYKAGFRYCDFSSISLPKEIQEIGEEAFAYCMNLTSFTLPFGCTKISPSMLMDCRELETFSYQDSSGSQTNTSSVVTHVGDHAFINCVKLKAFNCPTSLIYVGDSAFNNCKTITTIFFPKTDAKTLASVPDGEKITLGNYAFAQCDSLTMVYFDLNMWKVGQHVFNRCNIQKLNINYTGSTDDFEDPEIMEDVDPDWRDRYTALGNNEQFNFIGERGKINYDSTNAYPGLIFTIDNNIDDLMLDQSTLQTDASKSWQAKIFRILGNNSLNGSTEYYIDRNDKLVDFEDANHNVVKKYATIVQFETPTVNNSYYSNGALTIPDTVTDEYGGVYPVRVIDSNVFNDHTELTSVSFGKYLVQIRHHSFLGCDNISSLNFSRCDDLLEISYEIFHKKSGDHTGKNTVLTSLQLPNCLKYIGASAFYNFTKVTSFHISTKTVFVAQSAFENLGSEISGTGTVDLLLPNTLRDGPVDQAGNSNGKPGAYGFKIWRYEAYANNWDECIQVMAFKNAKCLKTVTIEAVPTNSNLWSKVYAGNTDANGYPNSKDHHTMKPYRVGLQNSAFEGCTSLVRFEANKLLYVIGQNAFKGCTALKEMFLCTFASRITNVNNGCAWGFSGTGVSNTSESSIFGTDSVFTDLVVYIDDPAGPPKGNKTMANKTKWNSVMATYPNELSTSSVALVPSYDGVVRDEVKYYDLTSNAATTPYLDTTDFSTPSVAFIKKTDNYTITRCYCGNASITSTIDMAAFTDASSIKTIGSGSFGQMDGFLPSRSVILPSSVTTIGDRAFYRACSSETNDRGMQIITYKDGGTVQSITNKTNYCILPPSVTSVGRLAFYNNCFEAVSIKGNLAYLGNTAFGVYPSGSTSRATISSVALGIAESTFMVSATNGGLYYNKETARKTLIYQPASFVDGNNSTDDTELRIDSDAYAVGARACANTTYESVSFPNSVSTIYGGAFTKCLDLESVSFGNNPGLKYIGACAYTPDTEVWNGSNCDAASEMNDVTGSKDITFNDYYGVFKDDTALADFDFTELNNSLVKIGYGAFEGCSGLINMVGSKKYTYYTWNKNNSSLVVDKINNVNSEEKSSQILDLSGCENLRAIGYQSFKNCSSIKYVHLPDNYDTVAGTALYLGSAEPESGRTPTSKDDGVFAGTSNCRVLIGEKSATANVVHNTNNSSRYPSKAFSGVTPYYHAESSSDIYSSGEAKYWYELDPVNGTRRFVLLNDKSTAQNFFSNASNLTL